ncbi:MAG: hypothetical protein O7G85_14360, partial [Planctomycetota bacterium]|nr:hypothetical protein [Planctomycetota bacterium]
LDIIEGTCHAIFFKFHPTVLEVDDLINESVTRYLTSWPKKREDIAENYSADIEARIHKSWIKGICSKTFFELCRKAWKIPPISNFHPDQTHPVSRVPRDKTGGTEQLELLDEVAFLCSKLHAEEWEILTGVHRMGSISKAARELNIPNLRRRYEAIKAKLIRAIGHANEDDF